MNSKAKSILGFSNSEELYETQKDFNAIKPLDPLLIKPPTSEFMTETPSPIPINTPQIRNQDQRNCEELKLRQLRILPKLLPGGGIGIGIGIMAELENDGGGDDNGDGCRTPTSIHHKIPLIQQCPYAPKKPKSIPCRKRRSPSSNSTNHQMKFIRRRIDFYDCLSPLVQTHLEDLGCRIKKIRATPPTSPYKI